MKKRRFFKTLLFLLIVTALAFFYVDQQNGLDVTRLSLAFSRLPPAFDGMVVVQLSDLHEKEFGQNNQRLLEKVRDCAPDLIAITGDLIDGESGLPYASRLCEDLLDIAPVYYVTGNHEWGSRAARQVKERLTDIGCTVLSNESLLLTRGDQSIVLAGLDDPLGPRDQKTLSDVCADIRQENGDPFILLLAHRYERWDSYRAHRIDLTLTGHAHGGIVRLPFTDGLYGPFGDWFPRHTSGITRNTDAAMVTSRGLGGVRGVEIRLFNRPEVVAITLQAGGS